VVDLDRNRQPALDVRTQTLQVLHRIDELLAVGGTDRSKLLTLRCARDMALFGEHNDAWNEWVDVDNPPCGRASSAAVSCPACWSRSWSRRAVRPSHVQSGMAASVGTREPCGE